MKVLLRRRRELTFGQDQRAAAVADRLDFAIAGIVDGAYRLPEGAPEPALIVSFNSHQRADVSFADQYPNSKLIVHLQLRRTFFGDTERARHGMASPEQERALLLRASHVIVPARFMAKLMADDLGSNAIHCIRNGVDIDLFCPPTDPDVAEYRAGRDIPDGAALVAFVGQLSDAKGWQILREVAARLPADVFLVVRSLPPYRERLRELQALNAGRIRVQEEDGRSRDGLPSRFADALLITSLSEVAPLVCSEALASGVPVISTDCTPFYGELAADGLAGGHVSLVPLPRGTCERPMDELRVTGEQAATVAIAIADRLRAVSPIGYDERIKRHRQAIAAGFAQDRMLNEYVRLYNSDR